MCCGCGGGSTLKSLSISGTISAPTLVIQSGNNFSLNVDFSDNSVVLGTYDLTAVIYTDQNQLYTFDF